MELRLETNTENLINKINEDIKKELSEKRYNHSVGVMKKAEELAKIYGIDVNKAKLVGLAHDIGKELIREEKLKYIEKNNIEIDETEKINVGLLHAKIGADICKKRYNFDEEMQDAIKYHTTGNENMNLLAKIIFVADKIEENRKYENENRMKALEEARKLSVDDINKALLYLIDESIVYTTQKKELIHIDSIKTRNKIITKYALKFNNDTKHKNYLT